jgi:hypothetical protein
MTTLKRKLTRGKHITFLCSYCGTHVIAQPGISAATLSALPAEKKLCWQCAALDKKITNIRKGIAE